MKKKRTAKIDKAENGLVEVSNGNQVCPWDKKSMKSMIGDIKSLLETKLQVILTGVPGAGKTYMAREVAKEMAKEECIESVQFHPGWSYSDFVIGMKPVLVSEQDGKEVFKNEKGELYTTGNDDPNGKPSPFSGKTSVSYAWKDGVFRKFAAKAKDDPEHNYVFLIDEINRADILSVFGEVFSLLDREYRYSMEEDGVKNARGITLPNGCRFVIPKNLYIICTMNNVDGCVESMGSALRRRFAWYEIGVGTEESRHGAKANPKGGTAKGVTATGEQQTMKTGNESSKWDTSHLASADIADLILEDYEKADRDYALSWKRINGEDWVRILVKLPHLVDKCNWSEVTNADWVELLRERPEFVELCKDEYWKSKMWTVLTERDWAWLLDAQPQLAKYKPEK